MAPGASAAHEASGSPMNGEMLVKEAATGKVHSKPKSHKSKDTKSAS